MGATLLSLVSKNIAKAVGVPGGLLLLLGPGSPPNAASEDRISCNEVATEQVNQFSKATLITLNLGAWRHDQDVEKWQARFARGDGLRLLDAVVGGLQALLDAPEVVISIPTKKQAVASESKFGTVSVTVRTVDVKADGMPQTFFWNAKKQEHPRTAASLLDDLSLPALSPEELDLRECTCEDFVQRLPRETAACKLRILEEVEKLRVGLVDNFIEHRGKDKPFSKMYRDTFRRKLQALLQASSSATNVAVTCKKDVASKKRKSGVLEGVARSTEVEYLDRQAVVRRGAGAKRMPLVQYEAGVHHHALQWLQRGQFGFKCQYAGAFGRHCTGLEAQIEGSAYAAIPYWTTCLQHPNCNPDG